MSSLLLIPLHGIGGRQDRPAAVPAAAGRCGSRGRGRLLRPRRSLADSPLQRDRHWSPAASADQDRRLADHPVDSPRSRAVLLLLGRDGAAVRTGPSDQPDLRIPLCMGLDRPGAPIAAVRAHLAHPQPTPHTAPDRLPDARKAPNSGLYGLPPNAGIWPAAIGLFTFIFLEWSLPAESPSPSWRCSLTSTC
jgi:hypothetical protein